MTTKTAPRATSAAGTSPPGSGRMKLSAVHRGVRSAPDKTLLTGVEGIGKTTWGSEAPAPIFIATEDGIRHLDVASFPEPQSFQDVLDAVRTLTTEPHEFKTVVFDTIDWVEPLIHDAVCQSNGWKTLEDPGYGRGPAVALVEWRKLLAALDRLRAERGMEIILLAHATIRTFSNPAGSNYDRYELKLQRSAAALVKEWTDANLFAIHEDFIQDPKERKSKAFSTGRRVVHTERTSAWDAKNRHGLPPELPLSYAEYAAARAAGQPADPKVLRREADALVARLELDEPTLEKTRAWLDAQATRGATALARAVDRLRSKVAAKEGE
jgi:hypothetical protein